MPRDAIYAAKVKRQRRVVGSDFDRLAIEIALIIGFSDGPSRGIMCVVGILWKWSAFHTFGRHDKQLQTSAMSWDPSTNACAALAYILVFGQNGKMLRNSSFRSLQPSAWRLFIVLFGWVGFQAILVGCSHNDVKPRPLIAGNSATCDEKDDWPMFQKDATRRGSRTGDLRRRPEHLWTAYVGVQSWLNNPVITGNHFYVGSSGTDWNKADKKDTPKFIYIMLIPIFIGVGFIEMISIAFRPVSLSFRLYGNVFGGENLLDSMTGLAPFIVPVPFYLYEVLVGVVQALIFTLLVAIYIGLMTNHDEDHAH